MGCGGRKRREAPPTTAGQGPPGRPARGTTRQTKGEAASRPMQAADTGGRPGSKGARQDGAAQGEDQSSSPTNGGGAGVGGGRGGGDGTGAPGGHGVAKTQGGSGPRGATARQRDALSIMYCNAQSIVKKIDELNCYCNDNNPDIILITETWCHQDISDAYLSITGYDLVPDLRVDRGDTAHGRGGGLLVYAKTGLSIFKIDTVSDFQQYCCFKVSDVTFFLVYRSPNAPPASIDCLEQLIRAAPKNSIIIGDINLPEVDWEVAAGTGKAGPLLEAMQDRLLTQLIDFPTQVSGNILDLLITDMPERIQDIKPDGRLGGSDHVVINCTVTMDIPRTKVKKSVLMCNKADFTGMGAQLGSTPWEDLFRTRSANEQWEVFRDHLQAAVNKYVPVKQAGPPGRPPWMSREISAAIRSKRRLWRETQSRGRTEEYRRADKEVKKLIRKSKREYDCWAPVRQGKKQSDG